MNLVSTTFGSPQIPVKLKSHALWITMRRVDTMNPESTHSPKSPFKNPLLYSSFVIFIVALYVSYVLIERYESHRAYERQTRARQAERRLEDDRIAVEQLGGSELAIRGLYLSPPAIHPGESAQLCYDVANARAVTLDPPVAAVWPSHSRCVNVSPRKTTTFTLTIQDAAGKTISQTVELPVR